MNDPKSNILLIDKPEGITSHDVIDIVRKKTGVKKVGHAGTLDPFATGLLLVAVGRENTKRLDQFKALPKEYEATGVLGSSSDTGDLTGTITRDKEIDIPPEALQATLQKFIGQQTQIPPMYSAKKVGGKKLYELARQGKTIERAPHKINVYNITLLRYNGDQFKLRVNCSAGTYIRTLIEDIANALGTSAYTRELRRTKIGDYSVKDAIKPEDVTLIKR